jgi:transcriptional regulator with GAF, ATPase, and Fis domain
MATDCRYRALLDVSSAIVEQSTIDAVLRSLRRVLSKIAAFDSVDLYLLSEDRNTLHLVAFDRAPGAPPFKSERRSQTPVS